MYIIEILLKCLFLVVPLLIGIAYLTLAERKVIAAMQRRRGPNVVGVFGILQPLADGLKLFLKETILPSNANKLLFVIAPVLTFFLSLVGWSVIPFNETSSFSDLNLGVLYMLSISSLSVYGILISGWSSNSKYAFLGGLRSAAQMISYEISIGLIILALIVPVGSLNLYSIVESQQHMWFAIPFFPSFFMFLVSLLAETNRAPFDLPEAEAELVAGFNVEYSAMGFALFFLGEYSNILLMSSFCATLFLGGWLPIIDVGIPSWIWFAVKVNLIVFFVIWARVAYPRFRYDQLMSLGWKVFLPFSFAWLVLVSFFFKYVSYNYFI